MRMRIVLAMAATVAALVTAGPVPGAQGASDRALPTRERRGPTYFSPDPGPRLIVLSPGETASADVSFGVAGQRSDSVLAT